MSEETAVAPVAENPLDNIPAGGVPSGHDDAALEKAIASKKFLPRLQLMTANSGLCKEGKFPVNHWALVRDSNFIDLGEDVDAHLVSVRPKALDMGDVTISIFDPDDPQFAIIADKAENKIGNAMYGLEFLTWVPEQESFATLFLGSSSGRRETPVFKSLLGQAVTCKSFLAKNSKFTWFAATAVACSTPLSSAPTAEDMNEVVERFLNPPKSEVEAADDTETAGQDRAR